MNQPGPFSAITHLLDIGPDYIPEKHRPVKEALPGRPIGFIKELLKARAEAYGKSAVRCAEWGYPEAARVWAIWAVQSAKELVELEQQAKL
jgi:hypothetical protein